MGVEDQKRRWNIFILTIQIRHPTSHCPQQQFLLLAFCPFLVLDCLLILLTPLLDNIFHLVHTLVQALVLAHALVHALLLTLELLPVSVLSYLQE